MRSFSSSFGPSLPSLSFPEAVRLGRALVAAAGVQATPLPPLLRLCSELLAMRLAALARLYGEHFPRLHANETELDRNEKRLACAWEAFFNWMRGLSGLSGRETRSQDARALLGHLFPEGLSLVRPPPLLAWAESEARLSCIEREGFALSICAAGGAPFLEAIAEAHAVFGEALREQEGGALSTKKQSQQIRSFALALHAYLAALFATLLVDEAEPSSLASSLLAPIAHFSQDAEAPPSLPWEPFDQAWDRAGLAA